MKEYCVDLELAKELKENGFLELTEFYFTPDYDEAGLTGYDLMRKKDAEDYGEIGKTDTYPAPTSDEILKELPFQIEPKDRSSEYELAIDKLETNCYKVSYCLDLEYNYFVEEKLSNALAKMWLYLKKEGYIG